MSSVTTRSFWTTPVQIGPKVYERGSAALLSVSTKWPSVCVQASSRCLQTRTPQVISQLVPDEHDVIIPSLGPGAVHVGEHGEVSLLNREEVARVFHASSKRVLFFDYGGTLVDLEGVSVCQCILCVSVSVCHCCMVG